MGEYMRLIEGVRRVNYFVSDNLFRKIHSTTEFKNNLNEFGGLMRNIELFYMSIL